MQANDAPNTAALQHLRHAFAQQFGGTPDVIVQAPGRVNLIGEHTDYNDGFVLPMTLSLATYVALRKTDDEAGHLYALNVDETLVQPIGERPVVASGWGVYVGGVMHLLDQKIGLPGGFEAVMYGEVPIGSGLSSSAALEVAMLLGLQTLFGFAIDPVRAALLCQQVEHEYAGVQCGIMDQFAARLGRRDHALFLDCRSLAYEHVPMYLGEACILVVDSKAPRDLASSAYNARRAACEAGVAVLQKAGVAATELRDVTVDVLHAHREQLSYTAYQRCLHVVTENARVEQAVAALRAGDVATLGALMNASHTSLRDDYEVSSPPLDLLVKTAQACDGVWGARLTGAGFGGCIVVLLQKEALEPVMQQLTVRYEAAFDRTPAFYPVRQNVEAGVLSL